MADNSSYCHGASALVSSFEVFKVQQKYDCQLLSFLSFTHPNKSTQANDSIFKTLCTIWTYVPVIRLTKNLMRASGQLKQFSDWHH